MHESKNRLMGGIGIEPKFSDYYKPSDNQKTGEMLYAGGGMLALGYMASKFL